MVSAVVDMQAATRLPKRPPGKVLEKVTFDSCPGTSLEIRCLRAYTTEADDAGVFEDSWWSIVCRDQPDRYMRLRSGKHSLFHLLRRYGFLDNRECMNHRRCKFHYGDAIRQGKVEVEQHIRDSAGVPQFYEKSGVCWFASVCWVAFGNDRVKDFLLTHHPEGLRRNAEMSLFSRRAAEEYRKALWYDFAVGDDVEDNPLNDGKNGGGEFTTMCAKLHVPLIRLREEKGMMVPITGGVVDQNGRHVPLSRPRRGESHILMLRFVDGDHSSRFPLHRRIIYSDHRYRMFAAFLGQRKCGHQCALVCNGTDWRNWGVTDADAHKDGIGPCFCHFSDHMKDAWWEKWKYIVNVTKYGPGHGDFCPLSPWNVEDGAYDRFKGAMRRSGSNSIDVLYFFDAGAQKKIPAKTSRHR